MLTLTVWKLLADLGIYYSLAGFFAVRYGASAPVLLGVYLLQVLAGSLTVLLRDKRGLFILPLFLMLPGFFIPGLSFAGRIAVFPSAVYLVWVSAKRLYLNDYERQISIFHLFRNVLLPVTVILTLWHWRIAASITIPAALIGFCGCVLLLRALRHDEKIRQNLSWQIVNLIPAAAVAAAAFLLSSETVLKSVGNAVYWVYTHVVTVFLYLIYYLIMLIMNLFIRLFSWLSFLFTGNEREEEELTLNMESAADTLGITEEGGDGKIFEYIIWLLAVIAAVALVVALFRYLAGRRRESGTASSGPTRMDAVIKKNDRPPRFGGSYAAQVRRQYRRFLLLCRSENIEITRDMTSLDICRRCRGYFDTEDVQALREIYVEARYHDRADRESADEAAKLYRQISHGG